MKSNPTFIYFFTGLIFCLINNALFADNSTIFHNQISQMAIRPNSQVRIGNSDLVHGWADTSFVIDSGGSGEEYFDYESHITHQDVYDSETESTFVFQGTKFFGLSYNLIDKIIMFQDGFSVATGSYIYIKSKVFIACPFALNGGTMELGTDLSLSSTSSLCSPGGGGKIKGNGNAIIFHGDFEIPSGEYFHFINDTILEGLNHELILTGSAQLIVDMNTTLSLRNIILKFVGDVPEQPSIVMTDTSSKLALQNTIVVLSSDYTFTQGSVFIHDDTIVTGTSTFIYASNQPSFVTDFSTLYFDIGTTFSYAPSSASSESNSNLLKMENITSQLMLDNCALNVPVAGLNLTKGTLILNNKVNVHNDGGTGSGNCLKFGNGANEANDLNLVILQEGSLNILSGALDYSNVG